MRERRSSRYPAGETQIIASINAKKHEKEGDPIEAFAIQKAKKAKKDASPGALRKLLFPDTISLATQMDMLPRGCAITSRGRLKKSTNVRRLLESESY